MSSTIESLFTGNLFQCFTFSSRLPVIKIATAIIIIVKATSVRTPVGVSFPTGVRTLVALTIMIIAVAILMTGNLEEKVKHWKRFPVNKDSIVEDMEQEYLSSKQYDVTPLQEKIEKSVKGSLIEEPNKRSTYEAQFYEGHAAQGGRVIDVESHIAHEGSKKGKLIHFGQPANAWYVWIVDEEGNFIVANRQTFQHDMPQMNKEKIDNMRRPHKLPHSTLARGKSVVGAGEVLVEGGFIKAYNTASGHYIELRDVDAFNNQGKEVFLQFAHASG